MPPFWPRRLGLAAHAGQPLARALAVVLALIGMGSGLFPQLCQPLTGLADVLPILGFILLYLFAAARRLLALRPAAALARVLAFFPFAALAVPVRTGSCRGWAVRPAMRRSRC